jgi:hypothetical protein
LTTAPTPVSTAQPNSAASSNGSSRVMRTAERRERRAAEMMVDRLPVALQALAAREQPAGAIRRRAGFAQGRPALRARRAVAAARHEHQHDVIADREIGHPVAELLHHAGRLVPERHRQRARPVAVDHREIGVAQARDLDAHEDLARPGRVEIEFLDPERARLRIRERRAHRIQHCGLDLHGRSPSGKLSAARAGPDAARRSA